MTEPTEPAFTLNRIYHTSSTKTLATSEVTKCTVNDSCCKENSRPLTNVSSLPRLLAGSSWAHRQTGEKHSTSPPRNLRGPHRFLWPIASPANPLKAASCTRQWNAYTCVCVSKWNEIEVMERMLNWTWRNSEKRPQSLYLRDGYRDTANLTRLSRRQPASQSNYNGQTTVGDECHFLFTAPHCHPVSTVSFRPYATLHPSIRSVEMRWLSFTTAGSWVGSCCLTTNGGN